MQLLAAAIGDAPTLLTIDAAETMTDAVGALVLGLLASCGRVNIVVTSRLPLGVGVERVFPLTRLPEARPGEPLAGTDLQLMIDRAGYDELSLDESTLAELRRACAPAAGIPLLVELAARSFEPGSTAPDAPAAIDGDGFDIVRAAIAHSLESVDEPARMTCCIRGSVLPGGMSESMAAALGGMDAPPDGRCANSRGFTCWMRRPGGKRCGIGAWIPFAARCSPTSLPSGANTRLRAPAPRCKRSSTGCGPTTRSPSTSTRSTTSRKSTTTSASS